MKNFLYSLLGTVAGLWLMGMLMFFGSLFMLIVMAISSNQPIAGRSILYLNLEGEIAEYYQPKSLLATLQGDKGASLTVNDIVNAIDAAADDKRIEGIFIECNGGEAGMAQRSEIKEALSRFKKSEKWIVAYGNQISQGDYVMACSADSIFVNPQGMVDIHGLSATTLFYKGLLDKLGVDVQVVKVGTYKSAVEPYLLNAPSEASVEQQQLFLTNIWGQVKKEIARGRKVKPEDVDAWTDSLCMTRPVDFYTGRHIVDSTLYRHQMLDRLAQKADTDEPRLVTVNEYLSSADVKPRKGHAKIAVLYASGNIVDAGDEGISAEAMVPEILDLIDNDDIDGLVLRVNSGGGSAFASEQIWEALQTFKKETGKPFYVSMSDYAASGGYYISCGADKIFAEPVTITGSIGIFGLIPNAKGLITDKLGVTSHTVATNPAAALPTILEPMSATQRAGMQAYVDRGYETFVKRVADGRKMKVADVKAIAEGRVWDGSEALKRKLVDQMGGLNDALAAMAKELGHDNWTVKVYPQVTDKWWNQLAASSLEDVKAQAVNDALGQNVDLFETLRYVTGMSTLQARMDFIEIK